MKYLTLLCIICLIHRGWSKESQENKTFVPTREWQEIVEGQGVPAGLHIRINLETGKKEAKMLDDKDDSTENQQQKDAALSVVPESSEEDQGKRNIKKPKKVKHLDEALQKFGIEYTPKEKVENIIREYRSYEELKKSFESMRKSFKTDGEIIVQLIEEFRTSATTTDNKNAAARIKTQIQILESFNYLMSQFDNALVFVEKGGLELVLLPVLVNTTQSVLKVEAMRALGAMAQNNPRVQIKVFERNVGSYLAQIIMSSSNTEELSAALYAFSSLLRKFPLAQQRILSTSGTQALISVLNRDCELKIKIKAIVLIGDLLAERKLILSKSSVSEDPVAAAQYALITFSSWLSDHNYCEIIETLLRDYAYRFHETPDFLEYIMISLSTEIELCLNEWSQNFNILQIFHMIKKNLSRNHAEYHIELIQLVNDFLKPIFDEGHKSHDEL